MARDVHEERATRHYAHLLRAYPAAFREEYGREMRAQFRDLWRAEHDERRPFGFARLWLALLLDIFITVPKEHFSMLTQDLRFAWRTLTLRHNWSFSAAAILTLALGIGAVTAIFSVFHAVLLAPLPYRDPNQIVRVADINQELAITEFASSTPNFVDWQARVRSFTALAALRSADLNLVGNGEPERLVGLAVSAHLWNMLGIEPVAGRTFSAEEDVPGRDRVVMLSEGLWRRRYGADPTLIGRDITLNSEARTVIGILPQDVGFASDIDAWIPLAPDPAHASRGNRMLTVLGRLRPGVTLAQGDAELKQVAAQVNREHPTPDKGWSVRIESALEWIVGSNVRASLTVLLAAVALLLLVACANVASLQLTRATARGKEIGIRLALGASRARLIRQMVTESLALAAVGGVLGIALACLGVRALITLLPSDFPRLSNVSVSLPVMLAALLVMILTGLLFGLVPAAIAARTDPQATLRTAGRSGSDGGRQPWRQVLVGAQFALATLLVMGAVLLAQSFAKLQRAPLGFQTDHLLTATISLPGVNKDNHERYVWTLDRFVTDVSGLPGVVAAGVASSVPFGGTADTSMSIGPIPHGPDVPAQGIQARWRIVSPNYFRAIGVPLLRGRLFTLRDNVTRPVMISAGLARRIFPDGRDPIGRSVWLSNGQKNEVIGVVGDMRLVDLGQEAEPAMYFPTSAFLWPTMTVAVRTTVDPATLAGPVRQALVRADANLPLFEVQTMDRLVSRSAARPRLQTTLLVLFAGLALTLGIVGNVGVIAFAVARRTPELAVRLALGATPGQVMRDVMRRGLIICAAGLAVGLAGAWLLGNTLSTLLYEVRPDDPATQGLTALALLAVAMIACWLPARRATRINPVLALRGD